MTTLFTSSATFTRPADTSGYSTGDLVANSTTAGSVTPMSFIVPTVFFDVVSARLVHTSVATTNAKFTLYLYGTSPSVDNGDNGAFVSTISSIIGSIYIDCSTTTFSSSGSGGGGLSSLIMRGLPTVVTKDADGNLTVYGLLQANANYTPASAEVFTLTLTGAYPD